MTLISNLVSRQVSGQLVSENVENKPILILAADSLE